MDLCSSPKLKVSPHKFSPFRVFQTAILMNDSVESNRWVRSISDSVASPDSRGFEAAKCHESCGNVNFGFPAMVNSS